MDLGSGQIGANPGARPKGNETCVFVHSSGNKWFGTVIEHDGAKKPASGNRVWETLKPVTTWGR